VPVLRAVRGDFYDRKTDSMPSAFPPGHSQCIGTPVGKGLPSGSVVCATTADLNEPAIRAYEKQGYGAALGPTMEGIALRRLHKRVGATNELELIKTHSGLKSRDS